MGKFPLSSLTRNIIISTLFCSQGIQDISNTHDEVVNHEGMFVGNPVFRSLYELLEFQVYVSPFF